MLGLSAYRFIQYRTMYVFTHFDKQSDYSLKVATITHSALRVCRSV